MNWLSVPEFVDAIGGTTKAAEHFDVVPSAVSNWRARNRFPSRLHLRAARLAAARGLAFDPEAPAPVQEAAA